MMKRCPTRPAVITATESIAQGLYSPLIFEDSKVLFFVLDGDEFILIFLCYTRVPNVKKKIVLRVVTAASPTPPISHKLILASKG